MVSLGYRLRGGFFSGVAYAALALIPQLPAEAGHVALIGDSTTIYALKFPDLYAGAPGTSTFFQNLLGDGNQVAFLRWSNTNWLYLSQFYEGIADVTQHSSSSSVTDADLDSINLFVVADLRRRFQLSEIKSIDRFLRRGGNLLLMAEPNAYEFLAHGITINQLLRGIGVDMRVGSRITSVGTWVASGEQIHPHRLTEGVTTFDYGMAVEITGGQTLVLSEESYPIVATVFVPEPSLVALSVLSALGLILRRHSRRIPAPPLVLHPPTGRKMKWRRA